MMSSVCARTDNLDRHQKKGFYNYLSHLLNAAGAHLEIVLTGRIQVK